MGGLHIVAGRLETLAYVFGDHHGAVLAARTAKPDGQVTLPFANVMRQEKNQELRDSLDELPGLWKFADISRHLWVQTSVRPELRDEMRIR